MTEILSSIDPGTWVLLICFWTLVIATLSKRNGRRLIFKKKGESWFLDTLCLLVQGAAIPLLQVVMIAAWLTYLFPEGGNQLQLHPIAAFTLCFVGIDYFYYWNHRILHLPKLWPIHVVHHTAEQMDVLTTSRNTLWSSLFIVYLWLNGAMLYFLAEPAAYVTAITATAALDLWRHSPIHPTVFLKNTQMAVAPMVYSIMMFAFGWCFVFWFYYQGRTQAT